MKQDRFRKDTSIDGHPITMDGEPMTKPELLFILNEMQRCIDLSAEFYNDVMPQAGKLVFQNYAHVNELGIMAHRLQRND